jgi:hypothetical protein
MNESVEQLVPFKARMATKEKDGKYHITVGEQQIVMEVGVMAKFKNQLAEAIYLRKFGAIKMGSRTFIVNRISMDEKAVYLECMTDIGHITSDLYKPTIFNVVSIGTFVVTYGKVLDNLLKHFSNKFIKKIPVISKFRVITVNMLYGTNTASVKQSINTNPTSSSSVDEEKLTDGISPN